MHLKVRLDLAHLHKHPTLPSHRLSAAMKSPIAALPSRERSARLSGSRSDYISDELTF